MTLALIFTHPCPLTQLPDEAEIVEARKQADVRRRALTMKRSQSATALSMQRPVATAAASAAIAECIAVQRPASMAVAESVVMPDVELGSGQLHKTMSSQQLATVDIASSLPFTPITLVFKDIRYASCVR